MSSKDQSQEELAQTVIEEIVEFARTSPLNRMPTDDKQVIFDEPLVRFADGDDPLFTEYKTIIDPTHLTPREALAQAYEKSPDDLPERISVISWILPITEKTRKANRRETRVPSRLWSHTYWFGEKFNTALREYVVDILSETGCLAVAPLLQSYFKVDRNEKGLFSNWSERHIAYAAGNGTFSLSDGLITERGVAHRCGSVVTDLVLPASHRIAESPYANCLVHFDGSCKACVKRCPGEAISEAGHDKVKCGEYLRSIGYRPATGEYDIETSVYGCGLCQTKVPCEYGIPAKIKKEKSD
ncbi:epoxyqueuosine reductase [Chloroflexota bacterium]